MANTIRIDDATLEMLKQIEEQTGFSKKNILRQALDKYQRDKYLASVNAYYEALRADPELWKEELAEREIWERASNDGLEEL